MTLKLEHGGLLWYKAPAFCESRKNTVYPDRNIRKLTF